MTSDLKMPVLAPLKLRPKQRGIPFKESDEHSDIRTKHKNKKCLQTPKYLQCELHKGRR